MDSKTTLTLAILCTPFLAHAQANPERYLVREGRGAYSGSYASLESQGYQGQYGTYLYTTRSGRSSLGTPRGTVTTTPYNAVGSTRGGLNGTTGAGSGMGRTGGGVQ